MYTLFTDENKQNYYLISCNNLEWYDYDRKYITVIQDTKKRCIEELEAMGVEDGVLTIN